MAVDDTYTLPPAKTMDDINKVTAFIRARALPLRNATPYGSDEAPAFQALLDLTAAMEGSAGGLVDRGEDPVMLHFYLVVAARQWREHADFLPEWGHV
ncbi:hypothetical protein [Streptomyces olivaceiscleroticus]|uniref:Uncharacterized protein n=1 Tax=Streptomyces olivaceiscleroticus TaxID=68245 RepID=A0ABN1BLQ3_9ACTN